MSRLFSCPVCVSVCRVYAVTLCDCMSRVHQHAVRLHVARMRTPAAVAGDGRVEPVPVQVLPPGCGLDHVMQLRREGRLGDGHRRTKRVWKRNHASHAKSDVFGYLNAAFAAAGKPPLVGDVNSVSEVTAEPVRRAKKGKTDARLALNVKALEMQSTIDQLTAAIAEFNARIKRNPGLAEQLSDQITWVRMSACVGMCVWVSAWVSMGTRIIGVEIRVSVLRCCMSVPHYIDPLKHMYTQMSVLGVPADGSCIWPYQ